MLMPCPASCCRSPAVGNGYITPWCGKDCTDAFDSDHGRHLGQALADLEYYLLGPLAA